MTDLPLWPDDKLERITTVIGALDSPLRLQILLLLNSSEHVVHELVDILEKSQPLVSQHLRILKNAGLVSAERLGREVVYRLADQRFIAIIESVVAVTSEAPAKPDFIDATESFGAAAADGPLAGSIPERDPGLIPTSPHPPQP